MSLLGRRLLQRLSRLLGQSRIRLPKCPLDPRELGTGDRLQIESAVWRIRGRLLLLSGDKGTCHEELLHGREEPGMAIHGSFSMMVNYHAIGQFFLDHVLNHRVHGQGDTVAIVGRHFARTKLRDLTSPTVAFKLDSIEAFRRDTKLLGRMTGDSVTAAAVVDSVSATLERVRRATANLVSTIRTDLA